MYKKNLLGFSLVEVLISIAALSIVSIVVSQSFLSILRVNTKAELIKNIKQSGDFTTRSMEQMIRANTDVTSDCSGTTTNQITLTNRDGYATTIGCSFDSTNNISRIASISGAKVSYLTPTNVSVGGTRCDDPNMTLAFVCTGGAGQPDSIRVSYVLFQASALATNVDRSNAGQAAFQTTITMRNN